jgi:hypothetical protein
MKYIKLFESFISEVKFYRFSKVEMMPTDSISFIYKPSNRKTVGASEINDCLVKKGFPNRNYCIHMMDELAFDPSYKNLYGNYIYNIKIDDNSKLGWSFGTPINDWFYKGWAFSNFLKEINKNPNKYPLIEDLLKNKEYDYYDDFSELDNITDILMEYKVIGTGKLSDLKKSIFWGNLRCFVWTEDAVEISKYIDDVKEEIKVFSDSDYKERNLSDYEIGKFVTSAFYKRAKNIDKEGALLLLDQWIDSKLKEIRKRKND